MTTRFPGTRTLLAAALAALGTAAYAEPGYVTDGSGNQVRGGFGQCVHDSSWTPSMAKAPCDPVPNAAPVVSAAPQPVQEEPAQPLAEQSAPAELTPAPPTLEKVTLSSDVLFDFNSATLKDSGKQKLDELAGRVQDANVEQVIAVGYADRIGSDKYNQKLSEERAQAVTDYLQGQGNIKTANLQAEGRGKTESVTGDQCKGMRNRQLLDCLQPDRRVEIEVLGTRETPGEPGSASTGATAPR